MGQHLSTAWYSRGALICIYIYRYVCISGVDPNILTLQTPKVDFWAKHGDILCVSDSLGSQRITPNLSWNIVHTKDGTWRELEAVWNPHQVILLVPGYFMISMDIQWSSDILYCCIISKNPNSDSEIHLFRQHGGGFC